MRNMAPLELDWILTVPLEFHWGHWDSSQVTSGGLELISSCNLELGVPLELQQESWASSRIVAGNTGFLSSCGGKLGAPLELRVGMQDSS